MEPPTKLLPTPYQSPHRGVTPPRSGVQTCIQRWFGPRPATRQMCRLCSTYTGS